MAGPLEDYLPIRRILIDGVRQTGVASLNIDSTTLTAEVSSDGLTVTLSGADEGSAEAVPATPSTLVLRDASGGIRLPISTATDEEPTVEAGTIAVVSDPGASNPDWTLPAPGTVGRVTTIVREYGFAEAALVGQTVNNAAMLFLASNASVELVDNGSRLLLGTSYGATLWKFSDLPGWLGDFDPGDASTLTLSGSNIQAARDAQGKGSPLLAVSTREPDRNTVNTYDGFACADFTTTGSGDILEAVAGGPTGAQPHAIVFLGSVPTTNATGLPRIGPQVAGTPPGLENSLVAGYSGTSFWGGGAGQFPSPTYTYNSGINLHIKTYDGTTRKVFLGGKPVVSDTPVYAISSGAYGLGAWSTGFLSTARVYRAMFAGGADAEWSRQDVDRVCRALGRKYPTLRQAARIVVEGTSLAAGTAGAPGGSTVGNCWPERMIPLLNKAGVSLSNVSTGGALLTGGGGLAAVRARVDDLRSTLQAHNILILDSPVTNDIAAGSSVATLIAAWRTYLLTSATEGFTVFSSGVLDRSFTGPQQIVCDEVMRWWEGFVPPERRIDWRLCTGANDSTNLTYFYDGTHQTSALLDLQAAFAADVINDAMGW